MLSGVASCGRTARVWRDVGREFDPRPTIGETLTAGSTCDTRPSTAKPPPAGRGRVWNDGPCRTGWWALVGCRSRRRGISLPLAGSSPRRATHFLASPRKWAKKATRFRRSAFSRLPCAARVRRPAQNSPCGLRQLRRTTPPAAVLLGACRREEVRAEAGVRWRKAGRVIWRVLFVVGESG